MKKAKIALTAVAVLAVVGGALAFKARNLHTLFVEKNEQCTLSAQLPYVSTTATTIGGNLTSIRASFISTTVPCPVITVKQDA